MHETITKPQCRSVILLEDTQLIAQVVKGDRSAQEEFVRRFEKLIRVILSRMALTRQEQEDLFQQVFVHLWEEDFRRLQMWDADKGRLCSYLGVAAARLAYDYIRRRTTMAHTTDISECYDLPARNTDLTAIAVQSAQAEAINLILSELTPRDSSLIRQRHYHGRSYREIAAAMGMTIGNVGVALSRAESRLQAKLHHTYPDLFDVEANPLNSSRSSRLPC